VISGVHGAGKATVAGLLADSLPVRLFLTRYPWRADGPRPMGCSISEPADEAHVQLMIRSRNMCLLVESFAEAGFIHVIDHDVANPEMLEAINRWPQHGPVPVSSAPTATRRRSHALSHWGTPSLSCTFHC
jgi:hypothetical protein